MLTSYLHHSLLFLLFLDVHIYICIYIYICILFQPTLEGDCVYESLKERGPLLPASHPPGRRSGWLSRDWVWGGLRSVVVIFRTNDKIFWVRMARGWIGGKQDSVCDQRSLLCKGLHSHRLQTQQLFVDRAPDRGPPLYLHHWASDTPYKERPNSAPDEVTAATVTATHP